MKVTVASDRSAIDMNGIKGELVLSKTDIKAKRYLDA
jgi:hypothetical protein